MSKEQNISDDLESKANEGLERFKEFGSLDQVESILNERIDKKLELDDKGPDTNGSVRCKKWIWYILAALVLALGALYLINKPNEEKIASQIFASNFEPFTNIMNSSIRGNEQKVENVELDQAMKFYEKEQYHDFFKAIDKYTPQSEELGIIEFYRAISFLATGDASTSLTILNKWKGSKDLEDISDAVDWYIALAQLQLAYIPEAKGTLLLISRTENYKKAAAEGLLKQLD